MDIDPLAANGNLRKYQNPNPLHRWLLKRFVGRVQAVVAPLAGTRILDAGCGEGFMLQGLRAALPDRQFCGLDLRPEALEFARGLNTGCELRVGSLYALPFTDGEFELTICLEVLEHLEDPARALREIARVTQNDVVLSVPWEPFFSLGNLARGHHVRRCGRDPDHRNFWSLREFTRLVGTVLTIRHAEVFFPWIIVTARK